MSVKIGRLRMSSASGHIFNTPRSGVSNGGAGVIIRGSYRYHKGQKAKSDPAGRLQSHMQYLSGQRRDQITKGTDKDRQLYSKDGQNVEWKDAAKEHAGHFIEHRIIISPQGNMSEDQVHTLAQASIQEIQRKNPQAEITAHYAVHNDTDHRHAHLLITSPNRLVITKEEYKHLREFNMDMRRELEQGHEQNLSQISEKNQGHEQQQTLAQTQQQQEQGQGQEFSL